jgi:hypothetical protein
VRPNAFAVLRLLLENAGPLVTKQQVLDMVWPGTFVGDAVVKDNIRQLRKLPHYWQETVAAHADGAKYWAINGVVIIAVFSYLALSEMDAAGS